MPITRDTVSIVKRKLISVNEVTKTITLVSQVAQIHTKMKNMLTPSDVPVVDLVKVVTNDVEVAYVYCGGAHLFEECSANPISMNYVGSNKSNNSYIITYTIQDNGNTKTINNKLLSRIHKFRFNWS